MSEQRSSTAGQAVAVARATYERLKSARPAVDATYLELDALEACSALIAAVPILTAAHGTWRSRSVSAELTEDLRARVTVGHLGSLVRAAEDGRTVVGVAAR